MMKKGLFLLACTLMVAACGNKDSGSNNNNGAPNGQVATTALNACFNGQAPRGANCTNVNWANYSRYGFYSYGLQGNGIDPQYWNNSGGYYQYSMDRFNPTRYGGMSNYAAFCACRAGTIPVWLPQGGLGCMSNSYMPQNALYFGMGMNNEFVLNAQFASYNRFNVYVSGTSRSCYQGVANACNVGSQDCGQQAVCQASMNGSPIGICVSTAPRQQYDCRGRGRDCDRNDRWDRDDRRDDRNGRYDDSRREDGRGGYDNRNGGYSSTGSITSGGGNR